MNILKVSLMVFWGVSFASFFIEVNYLGFLICVFVGWVVFSGMLRFRGCEVVYCLILLLLSFGWGLVKGNQYILNILEIENNVLESVRGKVVKIGGGSFKYFVDLEKIGGEVLVKLKKRVGEYEVGDVLEMRLSEVVRNNYVCCGPLKVEVSEIEKVYVKISWIEGLAKKLKSYVRESLKKYCSYNCRMLIEGILLGYDDLMSYELTNIFRRTGLTHILVISGFNVALLIGFVEKVLEGRGRRLKVIVMIGFVILFVLLVGAEPSIVRAGLMGIYSVIGKFLNRKVFALNALLVSILLMVLYDPLLLNFSLSFQLSVLATLGLILGGDVLVKLFSKFPKWIAEGLGTCLAAQIFVFGLTVAVFGEFSGVFLLANLLVTPLVVYLMILGAALLVMGIFPLLGGVVGFGLTMIVESVFWFIEKLALLDISLVKTGKVDWFLICVGSLFIAWVVFRRSKLGQSYGYGRVVP